MDHIVNLYTEIVNDLTWEGKTLEDIAYVTVRGEHFRPEAFLEMAKTIRYDRGSVVREITPSLEIVLKDGSWFERNSYDGNEWFDYKTPRKVDVDLVDWSDEKSVLFDDEED